MQRLYDEMVRRFPELEAQLSQEIDGAYLLMGVLADWVAKCPGDRFLPEYGARLVAFWRWIEAEPRGKDASDDLLTIGSVGLLEKLFRSENGRALLPKLIDRQNFEANLKYFEAWVDAKHLEAAKVIFEQLPRAPVRRGRSEIGREKRR